MNLTDAEKKYAWFNKLNMLTLFVAYFSMISFRDLYFNVTPPQSDLDLFHYEVTTSNEQSELNNEIIYFLGLVKYIESTEDLEIVPYFNFFFLFVYCRYHRVVIL